MFLLVPTEVEAIKDTSYPVGIYGDRREASLIEEEPTFEQLVINEFGRNHVMYDIAWCESRFRQFNEDGSVLRGEVNPADVGGFQINEDYHKETAEEMNLNLHKPIGNIAYAIYLYNEQGTDPWIWSKGCWQDR